MPGNIINGIGLLQCPRERRQRLILSIRKRHGIAALKLHTDGKIVDNNRKNSFLVNVVIPRNNSKYRVIF